MKRYFLRLRGFTLIELLVVISIIAILASMTMGLVGYANRKAATDRARAEIAALSVAIESYKIDNGDYPRDATTDALNAQVSGDARIATNTYPPPSLTLYKALSGDTDANRTLSSTEKTAVGTVYFSFKPNMLYPKCPVGAVQTPVTAIADPFRNAYGYSTIGTATSGSSGNNPTFDLWSTADITPSGSTPVATWITNW